MTAQTSQPLTDTSATHIEEARKACFHGAFSSLCNGLKKDGTPYTLTLRETIVPLAKGQPGMYALAVTAQ